MKNLNSERLKLKNDFKLETLKLKEFVHSIYRFKIAAYYEALQYKRHFVKINSLKLPVHNIK